MNNMQPEQPPNQVQPQPLAPAPTVQSWRLRPLPFAILLVALLIVITGVVLVTRPSPRLQAVVIPPTATVHITNQGFQPATLSVKTGTSVVWINDMSNQPHIIASNPYPLDNTLPGLKSPQLGSGAQFSYVFHHAGSYGYHDNLNPTTNGTITVKD